MCPRIALDVTDLRAKPDATVSSCDGDGDRIEDQLLAARFSAFGSFITLSSNLYSISGKLVYRSKTSTRCNPSSRKMVQLEGIMVQEKSRITSCAAHYAVDDNSEDYHAGDGRVRARRVREHVPGQQERRQATRRTHGWTAT